MSHRQTMSASIPIPTRQGSSSAANPDTEDLSQLGKSLPSRGHRSFYNPSSRHRPPPLVQDELSTSWPPRPSVELISRSARKWISGHRNMPIQRRESIADDRVLRFEPWDFSEVALATNEVRTAFQHGNARAERPPREGVCGTYFIRSSSGQVLCVFKPADEEAADIDMSPTPSGPLAFPNLSDKDGSGLDFSLGPAHGPASPLARSPLAMGYSFNRTGSLSSDSDYESRTFRGNGFHAGEGAYKEVAAYLLDHDRFARVPQTALATCQFSSDVPEKNQNGKHIRAHSITTNSGDGVFRGGNGLQHGIEESTVEPTSGSRLRTKMGALQVYVENVGDADDFGPGVFDLEQVQRIAVLDMRTLNHDRHGGNILVAKSSAANRRFNLIPIDHGYILPEFVHQIPWPVWMDWPMIRQPVTDRVKSYIEHLDADSEANILDKELDGKLRPGSLQGLKIATMFLQKGVAAGLTLYEIGSLMYTRREDPYELSELGKIMKEAEDAADARDRNFTEEEIHLNPPLTGEDHLHRRHQSMSALHIPETFNDDYIVRYAGRRIQEVINLAVAKKQMKSESAASESFRPSRLPRARSIPDFGIGIKPIHAILHRPDEGVPMPTPVSSPVSAAAREISANESLEAQIFGRSKSAPRQAPIRIPINDGSIRRIAIPEPRASQPPDGGRLRERSVSSPIPSDRGSSSLMDNLSSGALPPLFKAAATRKSSPVAPQELVAWETGSS